MWNSHTLLMEVCNSPTTLENILAVSYKTKHTLPCDLAISFLVSYIREMKHIHKKMKKNSWHLYLQCSLTGNNPEEYAGMLINIKITRIHATTWMDLKNITLSERSPIQQNSSNFLYEALEHTKVICCGKNQQWMPQTVEVRTDWEEYGWTFWGDKNVLSFLWVFELQGYAFEWYA